MCLTSIACACVLSLLCVQVRQKLQSEKFDFDRFKRRHVLLRVSYFGWDYMGFATQVRIVQDTNNLQTMEFVDEQRRRMLGSR